MSKRHHSSRRRAYGRRQHEVHERQTRRLPPGRIDHVRDALLEGTAPADPFESFAFVESGGPRLRFALGD